MLTKLHPGRATRELGRSFVWAFAGLLYTLHTQRNMRFHIFFAVFAMAFYVTFDVPFEERGLLLIAICLVPAFEIINTSIESITDYVATERHELVKHAKDTAAGAVLVMALLSMAMGGYVLLPRFIDYYREPSTVELTATGVRFVLAWLVLGSLLAFWLLRSLRYLFKPLLAVASLVGGLGSMALCLCGRDPSAFVAMVFLVVIELNAFARMAFEVRIQKAWERENLPFDTAGFRIIIPYAAIGSAIGAYLATGILSPFWR
jgi:diacylglycerol kinase